MALTLEQQYQTAMRAITRGDMDLMEKLLLDPDTVTIEEQRTVAEGLGVKGGLLRTFVNVISDPTIWIGLLMSRTFPVTAWLRGTIPKRYIGVANEFSGISAVTRPIEGFFRGTTIPKLNALALRRQAEVMQAGRRMFNDFNRPTWREDMPIVSLLLEGRNPTGATPELRKVATRIRSTMNDLWGFLAQTKKIEGGFSAGEIAPSTAVALFGGRKPRYLRDFLPHMPLMGRESVMNIDGVEALRHLGRGRFRQALELRGIKPEDVWRPSASYSLASDFTRYQAFVGSVGHQINPRLFARKRFGITLESELGRELFITDLNVLLPRYLESVARTYAINAPISQFERNLATTFVRDASGATRELRPTDEPIITQIINVGLKSAGARKTVSTIKGTNIQREVILPGSYNTTSVSALQRLVRSIQGKAGDDELFFGNLYSSIGRRMDEMRSSMTGKQFNEMEAAVKAVERTGTFREKVNGITSFFYATTLGLNPFSTLQNLFQPVLTTAPAIGIGATLSGYRVLANRIPKYMREVVAEHKLLRGNRNVGVTFRMNEAVMRGFQKTFPELAQQGIRIDPRLFDIDESMLTQAGRGVFGTRLFKNRDQYYKMLLQPFTHAEMSNQIVTFYGARNAIRGMARTGQYLVPAKTSTAAFEEVLNFEAGLIVNATQFRPGPGSRSLVQGMLPSPLRQFTTFPTRFLNYFTESTVRGAMSMEELRQASIFHVLQGGRAGDFARRKFFSLGTGRNLGSLARSYVFSKIAVTGARDALGVDIGGSLGVVTPFNLAPEGQPFAPAPFPPLPSVVYNIFSATTTRDIKRLQPFEIPGIGPIPWPKTLIPGGVAATRAARAYNQFRPDMGGFVDENERLMMRGSTSDLVLSMMGIKLDKGRRTRDVVERVQANRRRVRQFRRAYATAAISLDLSEMGRLRQMYSERFPDMPVLDVSPKDLRRYRLNARIPTVQRMLNNMDRASRFRTSYDLAEYEPELLADPLEMLQN